MKIIKIGLLDSGINAELATQRHVASARAFVLNDQGEVLEQDASPDLIDHGSAIAHILHAAAPQAIIVNAQVFQQANATAPATIAAGLDWLMKQDVAVVNMSFGLRQKRSVLQHACSSALEQGVILVASSPARGPAVYPAAYPGVIRVTGDARCHLGEFSHLATEQADFGACPRSYERPKLGAAVGGASFAVPHVVAVLAKYLASGGEVKQAHEYLHSIASYHGPERRR